MVPSFLLMMEVTMSPKILMFFFILFLQNSFPQEGPGKIISSKEADNLFGIPEQSYKISSSVLKVLAASNKYLYISFNSDEPVISNHGKESLFPIELPLQGDEIFHIYSSSLVKDLISLENSEFLLIEKRGEIVSLSGDNYTLEYSVLCPPICCPPYCD
jgi:hypothetical protein